MAQLSVNNLTFHYEGSFDDIFENVSFSVDTNWKLGLIGRNGKGKTTFLRLLMGNYSYEGSITASTVFDYFPYPCTAQQAKLSAAELMDTWKSGCEDWRVLKELPQLSLDAEVLYRPFETLSFGERTKVMLAVLFSGENDFLLIDEPTNHLDRESRELIKSYLHGKKGFILVSHDRDLLDACIDHVLVLNRSTITVQNGNFSTWMENKERADSFARAENEKHKKAIGKLEEAAERAGRWAEKNEGTKIGFDPIKEHDRSKDTRGYIGAKTKHMQSRVKAFEGRIQREIEEKEGLLQDIEEPVDLKLMPLTHYKKLLIRAADLSLSYEGGKGPVFEHLNLELKQGDRFFLSGENGCGKSSLIKAILQSAGYMEHSPMVLTGELLTAPNLVISYINQDTSHLKGTIAEYAKKQKLDYSLLLALLRQLDFERVQFVKPMESFSEGQKKKVLIAASLMTPAHLYIWDEPLNYIDVFSRMQIEDLIRRYEPTMLLVEHDVRFREDVGTSVLEM